MHGKLRLTQEELDEVQRRLDEEKAANGEGGPPTFTAQPYVRRDPKTIPPRKWLHAGHYIRGFLSATIAPGGIGKTSLQLVEAVGMVCGRDLLRGTTARPLNVWYWNLEDPSDEIDRRIAAILLHYKIEPGSSGGRLFVNCEEPLIIASTARDETVVAEPIVGRLMSEIVRLKIDVLTVDPFVSSHRVPENDNGAIDTVAKTWSRIARTGNCAVEVAHHIRKPSSGSTAEITVDDARGAGALKDAGRSVRVLNIMSKEEAESVSIKPEQRRSYFHVDAGKANMKPPAESIDWRKIVSVPLDNGTDEVEGDWVGVVTKWKMPGALEGLTITTAFAIYAAASPAKALTLTMACEGYNVVFSPGSLTSHAPKKDRDYPITKVDVQNDRIVVTGVTKYGKITAFFSNDGHPSIVWTNGKEVVLNQCASDVAAASPSIGTVMATTPPMAQTTTINERLSQENTRLREENTRLQQEAKTKAATQDPYRPTVTCADGFDIFGEYREGMCSNHGGVKQSATPVATLGTAGRDDNSNVDEAGFISVINDARSEYNNGSNDMAKGAARVNRRDHLCQLVKSMAVRGWTGTIAELSSSSSGKGVLVVSIGPKITIRTTNNEISDSINHTLLSPSSNVFRTLLSLYRLRCLRLARPMVCLRSRRYPARVMLRLSIQAAAVPTA